MFPTPLGSRGEQGHRKTPEQAPAVAALLRAHGEREEASAQAQAAEPEDVTMGVNEHRAGVVAFRNTLGQDGAALAKASTRQAQDAPSSWSAQDAAARKGVQAASMTFPTRLTSGALIEAHQAQQVQQGAAPAAVKPPIPVAAPTTSPTKRR